MVDWAPVRLPCARRMQTFAVLFCVTCLLQCVAIMALLFFHPTLREWYSRELAIAILVWTYVIDRNAPSRGGRFRPWVVKMRFWQYVQEYFPAKLHVQGKFDPKKQYVFGVHPHGIIGVGTLTNLVFDSPLNRVRERLGVDYRLLTVTFNFSVPLYRELLMSFGMVNASRDSAAHLLRQGQSVMVVVGGALEALAARPGAVDLTLEKRKGFVKLALKHGASLVPVFTFGENEVYDQAANPEGSWVRRWQDWTTRTLGFSTPVVLGRGIFQYSVGLLPHRRELNTVVGEAIELPTIAEPSDEEVAKWHATYVQALKALYDSNAKAYHHPVDARGRPVKSKGMRIVA